MNILRMVNPIMPYAWGSKTFIQLLTGNSKELNKPQAELWMGAHPRASSQVMNGKRQEDLHYILSEDSVDFLGSRIARDYQDQLPFLLKVLAAEQPLSIQVHPDSKQAKEGFKRENKLGIPLDAPNRNYRDASHKPELLVALTEFHALCGFRNLNEIASLLKKYLPKSVMSEISIFRQEPSPKNLKELYTSMLGAVPENKKKLLAVFLKALDKHKPETEQEQLIKDWTKRLYELYPGDIGVFSTLLLNIVVLKPMEGLFLEAGVPHSYLQGAGMEIMANSDNVLRGGLTPKHIDQDELLKIAKFKAYIPQPTMTRALSAVETLYRTPAEEFALSAIIHSREKKTAFKASGSPEILFCYDGNFDVENLSQFLKLEKGQSLFVPFEVEGYSIKGKGIIFRARCNILNS